MRSGPLETVVEKQQLWAPGFKPDLGFSVDAGREFGRTLETWGVSEFQSEYLKLYALAENPASHDSHGSGFSGAARQAVLIDGVRLYGRSTQRTPTCEWYWSLARCTRDPPKPPGKSDKGGDGLAHLVRFARQ